MLSTNRATPRRLVGCAAAALGLGVIGVSLLNPAANADAAARARSAWAETPAQRVVATPNVVALTVAAPEGPTVGFSDYTVVVGAQVGRDPAS